MKTKILHASETLPKPVRLFSIGNGAGLDGEHTVSDNCLLFNGGPRDFRDKLFALYAPLGNYCHCIAILWSEGEHTVWDDACDANLLDGLKVAEDDWSEDHCRLGNASEPFDLDNCTVRQIPASVWQADWQFVHALGRCAGGEEIRTGADL
jgi:hypothetical protein